MSHLKATSEPLMSLLDNNNMMDFECLKEEHVLLERIEEIRGFISPADFECNTPREILVNDCVMLTFLNDVLRKYCGEPDSILEGTKSCLQEYLSSLKAYLEKPSATRTSGPNDFEKQHVLQKTLFGELMLGTERKTGRAVALKLSKCALISEAKVQMCPEDPLQEIEVMRYLRRYEPHPHIISSFSDFLWDADHCLVLEFCHGGDMFDLLSKYSKFSEDQARCFFRQYIHQLGVVHLDLSLENILVDQTETKLKLIDFGAAIILPETPRGGKVLINSSSIVPGKTQYVAPEVFAKKTYDPKKCDMYSCGVVLFTMLLGSHPYRVPSPTDPNFVLAHSQKVQHLVRKWRMSERVSEDAISVLNALLAPSEYRPSAEHILTFKWFA